MNFNVHLKTIRKRYKITQKSISEYLGVTIRTYQRYEDGTIEPHLSTVMAIANYFNLPVDCLLGNGLFSNWEEILQHKDEILDYLKENILSNILSFPDSYDLSTLTESQLANILPAVFTKITFEGSTINLYSQIQMNDSSCPLEVPVGEY